MTHKPYDYWQIRSSEGIASVLLTRWIGPVFNVYIMNNDAISQSYERFLSEKLTMCKMF